MLTIIDKSPLASYNLLWQLLGIMHVWFQVIYYYHAARKLLRMGENDDCWEDARMSAIMSYIRQPDVC